MKVIAQRYRKTLRAKETKRLARSSPSNKKARKKQDASRRGQCHFLKRSIYEILRESQGGKCAYCHVPLRPRGGQVDRIIAGVAYTVGNCVLACAECNMQKSNRRVEDFLTELRQDGLIGKKWRSSCGRYYRDGEGDFLPNPDYDGSLSQELPTPPK